MENSETRIRQEMAQRAKDKELPCAVAFELAAGLDVPPETIGALADEMGLRLVKCQLGLFGYSPEKKIVRPRKTVSEDLRQAISDSLKNGRLPCRKAFEIARNFHLTKMDVSGACETLEIKIKPCQLGAF